MTISIIKKIGINPSWICDEKNIIFFIAFRDIFVPEISIIENLSQIYNENL